MEEQNRPNILEYIDEMMEQGYSEDDAAAMWFCTYDPENYEPEDGWDRWEVEQSRDDWDAEEDY